MTTNMKLGVDYQNDIFDAIRIIAESEAKKNGSGDETVECTIVDNVNAANGNYTIQYGKNTYQAFSNMTNLLKGMNVFVLVPGGDWNQTKFILGKKMTPTDSFIKSQRPFENYVDVTEDLVTTEESAGLVANGPIWVTPLKSITNIANGYNFTRMGVKADFKAWLKPKKARMGHYGLFIEVSYERKNELSNVASTDVIIYKLDSQDMIGNPYQYEVFTTQEKVIDISDLGKIQSINLYFYQDADFVDENYIALNGASTIVVDGEATGKYRTVDKLSEDYNDLFINNIYLSLGYDETDYNTSSVLLYTGSSSQYSSYCNETVSAETIKDRNTKIIEARWILQSEDAKDGLLAIDHEEEVPEGAEIYWFRQTNNYDPPKDVPNILGKGWEEIAHIGPDKLTLNFEPRIDYATEYLKCAIVYPTQQMCDDLIANEISLLTKSPEDVDGIAYDAAVATIRSQHQPVITVSPEIGFKNILLPKDVSSLNMAKGLSIITDVENQKGKYFLYGPTNEITSKSEENVVRKLVAAYNPIINDGLTIEDNVTQIKWEIPIINTMIATPVQDTDYFSTDIVAKSFSEDTLIITRNRLVSADNASELASINPYQTFKIRPYYTQNATNNTIKCTITFDNGNICVAETNLLFGQSGNSGTDATFVLGFQDGVNSIKFKKSIGEGNIVSYQADPVIVTANLFDYENKDITSSYSNITWEWYSKMGLDSKEVQPLEIVSKGDGIPQNGCRIQYNPQGNPQKAMGYILKASVQYKVTNNVALNPDEEKNEMVQEQATDQSKTSTIGGTSSKEKIVTLSAFLPIPLNFDDYVFAEAPNRIIYDSNGTNPAFYNNYLQLFKYDEESKKNVAISECEWIVGVDGEYSYKPSSTVGMTDEQIADIANIPEEYRKAANWKSYYPAVMISSEEYTVPSATLTTESYPVKSVRTIPVMEGLNLVATVLSSSPKVDSVQETDDVGTPLQRVTTTLTVIEEMILQNGSGAKLTIDKDKDSFEAAQQFLIEQGYKTTNQDSVILPAEGANATNSFVVEITYLISSEFLDSNGNISQNNDLTASNDEGEKTTTSILGPKIKAPNMYYNNLKKCVYLNCYTYYERESDDALEEMGTTQTTVEEESVDDLESLENDGYVIRPVYSQSELDSGTYYILQDTYVPISTSQNFTFSEDETYYKAVVTTPDPLIDEHYEPLGTYDSNDDDADFSPASEATVKANTTVYVIEEKYTKAKDYDDDEIYYVVATSVEEETNGQDTEDEDNSDSNTTPNVDDVPYNYGETDIYGNLLPVPGQKVLAWSQPILIEQNRYPSAMLNAWNGELEIDETNGTILSSMIAAGKKESDNSYTGVLIGDVTAADVGSHTGVYGFEHGQQCYAFKDDGTAFIGKSGSGQIRFDGNKGIIQSGSYESTKGSLGMKLDLDGDPENDEGSFIEMAGPYGEVRLGTDDPYFEIKAKNGALATTKVPLIYIGAKPAEEDPTKKVGEYYLQTFDFKTPSTDTNLSFQGKPIPVKSGMKIDLGNGQISSYSGFILDGLTSPVEKNDKGEESYTAIEKGIYVNSTPKNSSDSMFKITGGEQRIKVKAVDDKGKEVETENWYNCTLCDFSENQMLLQSSKWDATKLGGRLIFDSEGTNSIFQISGTGGEVTYAEETSSVSGLEEILDTPPKYCASCGAELNANGFCKNEISESEIELIQEYNKNEHNLITFENYRNLPSNTVFCLGNTQLYKKTINNIDIVVNFEEIVVGSEDNAVSKFGLVRYYYKNTTDEQGNTIKKYFKKVISDNNNLFADDEDALNTLIENELAKKENKILTDISYCIYCQTNATTSPPHTPTCPFGSIVDTFKTQTVHISNVKYQVELRPKAPYFKIAGNDLSGAYIDGAAHQEGLDGENDTFNLFYVGDNVFYIKSNAYYKSDSGGRVSGRGMYLLLTPSSSSKASFLVGQNAYVKMMKVDTIVPANKDSNININNNHNKGMQEVFMTGSSGTTNCLGGRTVASWNSTSKANSYNYFFRVTWNGAVFARAYYLLDAEGRTLCFAHSGDSALGNNADYTTRIPHYTVLKGYHHLNRDYIGSYVLTHERLGIRKNYAKKTYSWQDVCWRPKSYNDKG